MHSQSSLKREFLKKWVRGLQRYSSSKENVSLLERNKAVKLAADLAMASTRNNNGRRYYWSHALISKASNDSETSSLAKEILGGQDHDSNAKLLASRVTLKRGAIGRNYNGKKIKSRKSLYNVKKYAPRKSGPSFNNPKVRARTVAKRLVKKRTEILRALVPGGELMDESSLIKEALDYILTLKAQVDVMHHIAISAQLCDDNNYSVNT